MTKKRAEIKRRLMEILRLHLIFLHLSKLYGPPTGRPRKRDSEVSK